ncbi:MAG: SUF system Fe-S cluster assembly protein [Bacteroidales bacterium]|nr:SUF system Fe-S cluster assembly protein [Bacteroidales bacterium]HQK36421.1 SUF system Fe-S cluster assembly protein [Bacteroidales bacterium]
MENNFLQLETEIVNALKTVYDPEIPVNIFDLGLIYEIDVRENNNVYIKMTLTAPNCPLADDVVRDVKDAIGRIPGVSSVEVELTWNPPWNKDMMSEEAMLELGLL